MKSVKTFVIKMELEVAQVLMGLSRSSTAKVDILNGLISYVVRLRDFTRQGCINEKLAANARARVYNLMKMVDRDEDINISFVYDKHNSIIGARVH